MKQLYLVRHCQATGQAEEAPLTPAGEMQAELLADFLVAHPIDRIVSSPFRRARQTVAPLAKRLKMDVDTDHRLGERILSSDNLPNWLDCLQATFNDLDLCLSGGESSRTAMGRAVEAVGEVLALPGTTSVLVTHGNLLTLLLKHFDPEVGFATWASLTNPDVYLMTVTDHNTKVEHVWQGGR